MSHHGPLLRSRRRETKLLAKSLMQDSLLKEYRFQVCSFHVHPSGSDQFPLYFKYHIYVKFPWSRRPRPSFHTIAVCLGRGLDEYHDSNGVKFQKLFVKMNGKFPTPTWSGHILSYSRHGICIFYYIHSNTNSQISTPLYDSQQTLCTQGLLER
jgi:hypothetical protein